MQLQSWNFLLSCVAKVGCCFGSSWTCDSHFVVVLRRVRHIMVFIDAHNNDYKWKESFLSFQIWKLTCMNQFLMMLPSWYLSFMNCKHHVLILEQWHSQSSVFPGARSFVILRIGKIAIISISVNCIRNKTANAECRIKCTRARALGKWVTGPMITLHEPITRYSFLSGAGGQTDGQINRP